MRRRTEIHISNKNESKFYITFNWNEYYRKKKILKKFLYFAFEIKDIYCM